MTKEDFLEIAEKNEWDLNDPDDTKLVSWILGPNGDLQGYAYEDETGNITVCTYWADQANQDDDKEAFLPDSEEETAAE